MDESSGEVPAVAPPWLGEYLTVCVNLCDVVWIYVVLGESMQWVWIYDRVCVLVIFFLLPSLYKVYQVLMPNHDVW